MTSPLFGCVAEVPEVGNAYALGALLDAARLPAGGRLLSLCPRYMGTFARHVAPIAERTAQSAGVVFLRAYARAMLVSPVGGLARFSAEPPGDGAEDIDLVRAAVADALADASALTAQQVEAARVEAFTRLSVPLEFSPLPVIAAALGAVGGSR